MSTYLFDGFLRRVFSLLRAGGILYIYIYIALAWSHRYSLSKILSAFFTRSIGMRLAPSVHGDIYLPNWYSLPLFPQTEEGATSALGFWPIISPLSSSFPCQAILQDYYLFHPVTECRHLLAFILTWIYYFGREELT